MRKILLFVVMGFSNTIIASHVIMTHIGDTFEAVPLPTYDYCMRSEDCVYIDDSLFCSYLDSIVSIAYPSDTCACTNEIWHDMIHLVFVRSDHKYDIINLTHYNSSYQGNNGCLEINGQIMQYNKMFQIVMDNIINYQICYTPSEEELIKVIHAVLRGERYDLPYTELPPISVPHFNR